MKKGVAALAVVAIVASLLLVLVTRPSPAPVQGLGAVGADPFGKGDTVAGALRGILSPAGGKLAVLTSSGLGVAERGVVRAVTAPGSKVVDAAWFANEATLLVAEGPVPTGALAVVDLDGHVRGSIPLAPSLGFGAGYGMVVAPGGRRAVVTAVERPALGPEQRHLEVVDLETGATAPLTEPGGPDEEGPVVLDDGLVAFTEQPAGGGSPRARTVDLDGAPPADVADVAGGEGARVVAAVGGDVVVVRAGDLLRLPAGGGRPVRLATVPSGTTLTSVDAVHGLAAVVDRSGRLRRLAVAAAAIPR